MYCLIVTYKNAHIKSTNAYTRETQLNFRKMLRVHVRDFGFRIKRVSKYERPDISN